MAFNIWPCLFEIYLFFVYTTISLVFLNEVIPTLTLPFAILWLFLKDFVHKRRKSDGCHFPLPGIAAWNALYCLSL